MATQAIPTPDVMGALERLERSETFSRAVRQRNLLRHLVEKSLTGRAGEVKEVTIALEFFGRDSYDPQVDSLVRVEIAKLRQRLERYYQKEGEAEIVRIDIPRGSYQTVFSVGETVARPREPNTPWRVGAAVAAVLLLVAASAILWPRAKPLTQSKPELAVLPLEALSPGKAGAHFASGLTEELIHAISATGVFRVVPRSSLSHFNRDEVQAVVEGSVRREGKRLRINLRLLDTRADVHLWSGAWDRDASGLLELQREVARSVAEAFHLELPAARLALIRQHTRNSEAYTHYLHAAHLFANQPRDSIEHYKLAVAADPGYALAWAGLAQALLRSAEWEMIAPSEARNPALEAARKAVDLGPGLAEAWHARGVAALLFERDWTLAEHALRRAIELDRSNTEHRWQYARLVLTPSGRFAESEAQLRSAIAIEPYKVAHYNELGNVRFRLGQNDAALEALRESRRLSPKAPLPPASCVMPVRLRKRWRDAQWRSTRKDSSANCSPGSRRRV